jgi:hypothetical protein
MISTNAQATRPKHIGNLSLMKRNFNGQSIEEWKKYLTDVDPYIIDKVVSKIMDKSIEMCITAPYLNYDTIKIWAEDLIFNKTFIGFYIENLVFDTVSKKFGLKFHRQLTSNDESQGIDGYLNDKPFNVKPKTFKNKKTPSNKVNCEIIYYNLENNLIKIEYVNYDEI